MDTKLLADAIRKAIADGAVPASPMPGLRADIDINLFRAHTDVGIEQQALDTYLEQLKAIPEMALLDSTFATIPSGGGVSVDLPNMARLVLARAIASNDVDGTAAKFDEYISTNAADVIAVMAVSGIKADREIRLGPNVSIVPVSSLKPSMQRGQALGQEDFTPFAMRKPVSMALVTTVRFTPIFYRPSEGGYPSADAQARIERAYDLLHEARTLLAVLGIYPVYRMFWVEAVDWLMSAGLGGGWQFNAEGYHGQDVELDPTRVEALATAYFDLGPRLRHKALRIPLDRLSRSARERDFADRSIDLGIALEALLLNDVGKQDRGELRFRLSLRGAWLAGTTDKERATIQGVLKNLYDLRSASVHSGIADRSEENYKLLAHGTEICRRLITAVITAKCRVNWNSLVLGASAKDSQMWIFGYGSLMWDGWEQEYDCIRRSLATLRGHKRIFDKPSIRNWGTKANPGPTLNVRSEEGATCVGFAFEFPEARRQEIMTYLAKREGKGFSFDEITVELEDGRRQVVAIAPIYRGDDVVKCETTGALAAMVAGAKGKNGVCADYVKSIANKLTELGIEDDAVKDLSDALAELTAGGR